MLKKNIDENTIYYLSDAIGFDTDLMYYISKLGFEAEHITKVSYFYKHLQEVKPKVIIIDSTFSHTKIEEIISHLKDENLFIPLVSLHSEKSEKIKANYSHLFFIEEHPTLKSISSIFDRIFFKETTLYQFDDGLLYNSNEKQFISTTNKKIKLNNQESLLIETLLLDDKTYHTYDILQNQLSKNDYCSKDTLRTVVKTIRRKTYPNIISNLSGQGYKINLKKEEESEVINILICDDQKTNIEFLKLLLNKHLDFLNIITASDGQEAISILKKESIQILLLDIQMPKVNGWEVAKFIKKNLSEKNIATIFITSVFLDEEFQKEGFELGAVDYLTKPIDKNLLINRLKLYIKSFKQENKILKQIQKSREQEKELLQKEVLLAQSNILEKIAHHWRQPLSEISTAASFLSLGLESELEKEKLIETSNNIVHTTTNLSKLIGQFQTFFKPTSSKTDLNIKKIINEIILIMRYSFSDNDIKLKLYLDNIHCFGYENELKHIIISFLSNCVDALLKKNIKNKFIEVSLKETNGIISIKIIDNGGGVDKKIQNRIFEPYFTTKHNYSGTGLSLHLSKQIANRYLEGNITQENIKHKFKQKNYNCACFKLNIKRK